MLAIGFLISQLVLYMAGETLKIENEEIELVDIYKYLGKTVKMEDNSKEGILFNTDKGWLELLRGI